MLNRMRRRLKSSETVFRFNIGKHSVKINDRRTVKSLKKQKLKAEFKYQPKRVQPGRPVEFDASKSQGKIKKYMWDFDNDGKYEVTGKKKEKVPYKFHNSRDRIVTLKVVGEDDSTDTYSVEIEFKGRGGGRRGVR